MRFGRYSATSYHGKNNNSQASGIFRLACLSATANSRFPIFQLPRQQARTARKQLNARAERPGLRSGDSVAQRHVDHCCAHISFAQLAITSGLLDSCNRCFSIIFLRMRFRRWRERLPSLHPSVHSTADSIGASTPGTEDLFDVGQGSEASASVPGPPCLVRAAQWRGSQSLYPCHQVAVQCYV